MQYPRRVSLHEQNPPAWVKRKIINPPNRGLCLCSSRLRGEGFFKNWDTPATLAIIYKKSILVNVPYKLASIRAFYFAIINLYDDFNKYYDDNFSSVFPIPRLSVTIEQNFHFSYELMIDIVLINAISTASELANGQSKNIEINDELDYKALNIKFTSSYEEFMELTTQLNLQQGLWDKNNNTWIPNLGIARDLYDELKNLLKFPITDNLKQELLVVIYDLESKSLISNLIYDYIEWFTIFDKLKNIAIEHRSIGHEWEFSNAQKQLLQDYYDANKLLVDCLNSDCYVSREVRQEIEGTLLLPMSEIKQRKGIQ